MVKVLFIAYYFPPVGGAGVQRALKFVQYLPGEGFAPVVITGPASSEDRWTPRDATLAETIPLLVPVHRTPGPVPEASRGFRRRLETWLNWSKPFSEWWIRSATEVGMQVSDGCQLILATMSPFESGEAASELAERLGIPWVADLRDPWALDEMQVYPSLWHRNVEKARMERVLSSSALIVMNTPEAVMALKKSFPSLRSKTVVSICNGFDRDDFSSPLPPRSDRTFRIVHSGYLHTDIGQQLRERRLRNWLRGAQPGVDILTRSHVILLEAMERWIARSPASGRNVELVLAGRASDEDCRFASGSKVADLVRFVGYLPHDESVALVRNADLLFLPMHNLPQGCRSRIVPGKTYEYMASGRPILAGVPDGDARDFLSGCGTALLTRPDDVTGMAEVLDHVYGAWNRSEPICCPDVAFVNQFERRTLTHSLASAFASVLS